MSLLKQILIILALVCAAMAWLGVPCGAAPRVLPTDPAGPDPAGEFLMPGPITLPQSLVAAAERLQGTQVAMQRMADAGYLRTPEHDGVQSVPGRAFVALSYSDPANPLHAPLVLVASDATTSPTRVWIGGGVFTIDPATGHPALADDAPQVDPFIITGETASTSASALLVTSDSVAHRMIEYLSCAIPACGAGAGACAIYSAIAGPLAPPAAAGCVLATCGIAAYACLW